MKGIYVNLDIQIKYSFAVQYHKAYYFACKFLHIEEFLLCISTIYNDYICICMHIYYPYSIVCKLKGHLCTKKTNSRICNKGRINTLQSGVLDFNPLLSYAFSTLFFFSSLRSIPGPWFIFFTLSHRDSGLLSMTTRIPQQRSKVFIVISRATHPPPCSRDPSSTLWENSQHRFLDFLGSD